MAMTFARVFGVLALFALLAAPLAAEAQGRGRGSGKNMGGNGGGPAFCRSGAGHPVHGWQWCRDKGWASANRSIRDIGDRRDRRDDGIIILDPRDQDRDRDRDRDRDDDDRDRDDRRAEPRIRWPF
jgi:hypothetical protein